MIDLYSKVFDLPWLILPEFHKNCIVPALLRRSEGVTMEAKPELNQVLFTPLAAGAGLNPPKQRGSRLYTRGKLGVIPVYGIIGQHLSLMEEICGGYSVTQLEYDLELALEDGAIENILLDFHSPGGTVSGVPEAAAAFLSAGRMKETYAFTSGLSASASYWIMSQANHVFCTESSTVGSIGVYVALYDQTEMMKKAGVSLKLFKAGKHKAAGLPGNPLTEEDEALIQGQVDMIYKKFTKAITAKRPQVENETMQGQTFMGEAAKKAGLCDELVRSFNGLVRMLS